MRLAEPEFERPGIEGKGFFLGYFAFGIRWRDHLGTEIGRGKVGPRVVTS